MSSPRTSFTAHHGDETSRFTVRDLRHLSRYAPSCPLRVIALVDFDAFYAQCEAVRLGINSEDQPLAVLQFKNCIALNYAAKAAGLKRGVTPEDAKRQCPNVLIQHVATWREGDDKWRYRDDVKQDMETDKAALDPYRLQSRKAFELIKQILPAPPLQKVERASIDEVFLDLSGHVHSRLLKDYPQLCMIQDHDLDSKLPAPPTSALNWEGSKLVDTDDEHETAGPDWDDIVLHIGAEIVVDVRAKILAELKYTCSAGIAHNKVVSKLAAGHNKPNAQTIVRTRAVNNFLSQYKLGKIRGLGGKLGSKVIEACGTDDIPELLRLSLKDIQSKIGVSSGTWVYNVIRGAEQSEVVERTQLQSMLAAKTFQPRAKDFTQAEGWLTIFAGDLMGRLIEQDATSANRRPKVVALHHAIDGRFGPTRSKQMQIPPGARITQELLLDLFKTLLTQISHEGPTFPCLGLSVSLNNFVDESAGNSTLRSFFTKEEHNGKHQQIHTRDGTTSQTQPKRKRGLLDYNGFGEKSLKLNKTTSTNSDISAIQQHESDDAVEPSTSENLYRCPKCAKDVSDPLEHLDWHVAKELQNG